MTTSISAASVSLISAASSSTSTAATSLVEMANGEYTAASVAKDQTDAAKLGLVKEKDGNYGTAASSQVTPVSTASTLPSSVHLALSALKLGGA